MHDAERAISERIMKQLKDPESAARFSGHGPQPAQMALTCSSRHLYEGTIIGEQGCDNHCCPRLMFSFYEHDRFSLELEEFLRPFFSLFESSLRFVQTQRRSLFMRERRPLLSACLAGT